jgi:hypothetical protein
MIGLNKELIVNVNKKKFTAKPRATTTSSSPSTCASTMTGCTGRTRTPFRRLRTSPKTTTRKTKNEGYRLRFVIENEAYRLRKLIKNDHGCTKTITN